MVGGQRGEALPAAAHFLRRGLPSGAPRRVAARAPPPQGGLVDGAAHRRRQGDARAPGAILQRVEATSPHDDGEVPDVVGAGEGEGRPDVFGRAAARTRTRFGLHDGCECAR